MEDPDPRRMGDGIGTADGVKFVQQGCHVILGRVRRNTEPAGDQLVRCSLCQQRKHFQLSGGQRNVGFLLDRRSERGDHERVRFIVFADQLDAFNVSQNGRQPISESGVGHVDCQP